MEKSFLNIGKEVLNENFEKNDQWKNLVLPFQQILPSDSLRAESLPQNYLYWNVTQIIEQLKGISNNNIINPNFLGKPFISDLMIFFGPRGEFYRLEWAIENFKFAELNSIFI